MVQTGLDRFPAGRASMTVSLRLSALEFYASASSLRCPWGLGFLTLLAEQQPESMT